MNSDQGDSDLNGIGDACQRPEQLHATSAFLQAALDGSTTSAATDLAVADEPGFLERLVAIVRFRVASGLTNDPELLVQNLVGSLVQAGVVSEEEAPAFVDEVLDQLVLEVAVDVKPGTVPNAVNPSAKGIIPVAILSRNGFDALSVDPSTVRFGPSGASEAHGRGHREDVDGDGDWDLVLHFDTQRSGIRCGATSVSLEGLTFAGRQIAGSDSIVTVGCARR